MITLESLKRRIAPWCLQKLKLHRAIISNWGVDYSEHIKVIDDAIKAKEQKDCDNGR